MFQEPTIFFTGSKLFTQTRTNLNIAIVDFGGFECMELIVYDLGLKMEAPRIYLNKSLWNSKITESDIKRKLTIELEYLNRKQRKIINREEILLSVVFKLTINYIISRLNVAKNLPKGCFDIELTPNFSDILDKNTLKLDVICLKPVELVPYAVNYTRKGAFIFNNNVHKETHPHETHPLIIHQQPSTIAENVDTEADPTEKQRRQKSGGNKILNYVEGLLHRTSKVIQNSLNNMSNHGTPEHSQRGSQKLNSFSFSNGRRHSNAASSENDNNHATFASNSSSKQHKHRSTRGKYEYTIDNDDNGAYFGDNENNSSNFGQNTSNSGANFGANSSEKHDFSFASSTHSNRSSKSARHSMPLARQSSMQQIMNAHKLDNILNVSFETIGSSHNNKQHNNCAHRHSNTNTAKHTTFESGGDNDNDHYSDSSDSVSSADTATENLHHREELALQQKLIQTAQEIQKQRKLDAQQREMNQILSDQVKKANNIHTTAESQERIHKAAKKNSIISRVSLRLSGSSNTSNSNNTNSSSSAASISPKSNKTNKSNQTSKASAQLPPLADTSNTNNNNNSNLMRGNSSASGVNEMSTKTTNTTNTVTTTSSTALTHNNNISNNNINNGNVSPLSPIQGANHPRSPLSNRLSQPSTTFTVGTVNKSLNGNIGSAPTAATIAGMTVGHI